MEMAADGGSSSPADAIGAAVAQVAAESAKMAASAGQMLSSAQSGGFKITPEACDQWIQALTTCLGELAGVSQQIGRIRQAPKLGQTPGAKVVGPFTQKVATDDQGIVAAYSNSKNTLEQMVKAFQTIKNNYSTTEEQNQQAFRTV